MQRRRTTTSLMPQRSEEITESCFNHSELHCCCVYRSHIQWSGCGAWTGLERCVFH